MPLPSKINIFIYLLDILHETRFYPARIRTLDQEK